MNFAFIAVFSFHSHLCQESPLTFGSIDNVLSSLEARGYPSEEMLTEKNEVNETQEAKRTLKD